MPSSVLSQIKPGFCSAITPETRHTAFQCSTALRLKFPNATITYVPGTQFLRNEGNPVPDSLLTTPDGKPGLKAEYRESMGRPGSQSNAPPLATRTEQNVNLSNSNLPSEVAGKKTVGVHWTGSITPTETGDYLVGVRGMGFGRLSIDGKQVAMLVARDGLDAATGRTHLVKGQKVDLSLNYGSIAGVPHAQLIWAKVNDAPSPEAVTAAKNADIVIAVVGITSRLEGEEMP